MESIVYNLSNEQYHRGEEEREYLSSSQLKLLLKSPKYFRHCLDNPQEEKSDALRFGSLFHNLMACSAEHPDNETDAVGQWLRDIALFAPPTNDKTGQPYGAGTKAYALAYEEFLEANADKTIASKEEVEQALEMHRSLLHGCGETSRQVRRLLKKTKASEVSYFLTTENGVKIKARPDLLTGDCLVDWKSYGLDSLDEESIVRQIIRYRYDISLSQYQYVLHAIEGKWYRPILVFVQKTAPFDCVMCDISEWCYNYDGDYDIVTPGVGAMEFSRLLGLYAECRRKDSWPGAENAVEADGKTRVMKPKVPAYFGRKYLDE